jgi:hypothetical protein
MGTWTSLYVNTSDAEAVAGKIQSLSGIKKISTGKYPNDLQSRQLMSKEGTPDFLAIGHVQPGWVTVDHNSFAQLADWGTALSKELNCRVIVIIMQTTSDYYYFALYEEGKKLREIEVCYSTDFDEVDSGDKFSFEDKKAGLPSKYGDSGAYLFDFDAVEKYCAHFGLNIQAQNEEASWITLREDSGKMTVKEYVNKNLLNKKPWWQFW